MSAATTYEFRRRALTALGLFTVGMVGLTIVASRIVDRAHAWTKPAVLALLGTSLVALLAGVTVAATLRRSR